MPTPSTIATSPTEREDTPPHRHGWLHALRQRDRLWLLLILLLFAAVFLGGCHARSGGHVHTDSCGSSSADGAIAVFYVVYLLGWIVLSSAGG